jgi:hypothetical protein
MKTNPDQFEIELLDFVMNNNMNILWYWYTNKMK